PAGTPDDLFGSFSGDHNLIGTGGLVGGTANKQGTTVTPLNPLLGPLANNGGPTPTHALLAGSPAIDAGRNISGATHDQRGAPFLRTIDDPNIANVNDATDIGAFELQTVTSHTLVVDNPIDENDGDTSVGDLSLREAVQLANSRPGIDTIMFSPTVFTAVPVVPINLTLGAIQITDSVRIEGLGT